MFGATEQLAHHIWLYATISGLKRRIWDEAVVAKYNSRDSYCYCMLSSPQVNMKLEDQIRAAIRRRAYSPRTETA